MKPWTVVVLDCAARELRKLDEGPRWDALELIEDLIEDPAQVPAIQMRGYQNTWRARFYYDQYRMIFQISRTQRRVIVTRIRPRPIAYDRLKNPS